ncbi:hypothetical protein ABW21_db0204734 [Orbilia brochopaga]|nr:hypothetical protein ABW21_db0204734 [Drechslerella brochopaga]
MYLMIILFCLILLCFKDVSPDPQTQSCLRSSRLRIQLATRKFKPKIIPENGIFLSKVHNSPSLGINAYECRNLLRTLRASLNFAAIKNSDTISGLPEEASAVRVTQTTKQIDMNLPETPNSDKANAGPENEDHTNKVKLSNQNSNIDINSDQHNTETKDKSQNNNKAENKAQQSKDKTKKKDSLKLSASRATLKPPDPDTHTWSITRIEIPTDRYTTKPWKCCIFYDKDERYGGYKDKCGATRAIRTKRIEISMIGTFELKTTQANAIVIEQIHIHTDTHGYNRQLKLPMTANFQIGVPLRNGQIQTLKLLGSSQQVQSVSFTGYTVPTIVPVSMTGNTMLSNISAKPVNLMAVHNDQTGETSTREIIENTISATSSWYFRSPIYKSDGQPGHKSEKELSDMGVIQTEEDLSIFFADDNLVNEAITTSASESEDCEMSGVELSEEDDEMDDAYPDNNIVKTTRNEIQHKNQEKAAQQSRDETKEDSLVLFDPEVASETSDSDISFPSSNEITHLGSGILSSFSNAAT